MATMRVRAFLGLRRRRRDRYLPIVRRRRTSSEGKQSNLPKPRRRMYCTDQGPRSSGELVEKAINGGNPAVPGDDEISPGVRLRMTRATRHPSDPPAIAQLLGRGDWLISVVRMTGLEHARDAIDIVAATVCAVAIVLRGVFVEDLVDGRAPTRRVNFTEAVRKMAGQQGRYAVGHGLSPLGHPEARRMLPRPFKQCWGRSRLFPVHKRFFLFSNLRVTDGRNGKNSAAHDRA
jgi:hypothetical protein